MNAAANDIVFLLFGAIAILIVLTLLGDAMALRRPGPMVETYKTRVNSWWAMVILFALSLLIGRAGVTLLFAFAAFAALREFLTLSTKHKADHLALVLGFYVVLPLQFFFVWMGWTGLYTVFVPVYAFLLLPIASALRGDPERFLVRIAETQWGLMICVFCISHVPALMMIETADSAGRGILLIAFLIMVVQLGDLLDFYFGRRFGRRRIAPKLSPKTWEGLAAGVAFAGLIGVVFSSLTPFHPLAAGALAAVASLAGMFGNLVLTAIKHDRGVRDWSHLIPGQGGFLDQLDSVIFAAPIFYHLVHLTMT
ncbi:phosphatidate cytidylyltransferase [Ponticoccus sp. SC2-23]|uniref:phosphatidate cytidylyltransferase n=1 Tax=Alexandriicola marinus TaxID=2081710 RepID=UPI000FDBAAF6|nr:phosphatidate cytidylyltransferase [Alexandriicola marinus]MBM1222189.1 phosphatidate cytidylyltransferase [Ponticoccus sp. SC6-9]MBM1226876.1 phosphatidate cytidylyltransferase [Ponticoccus sp. SC6-15]MBM1231136.1 phosphatidate cytidylyltransferase [Ponticoccus sp. SC6-38]MBM1235612.1 phosphatidate cytidylyltransferase [Ponticoccus sp. SC6-45]MBM1240158.1 phosphatidate cytidylyltransferase [Ponticoccus sp. SC6-49]MBM1244512.1 phosphatidate cytidylyltransferase [Ponticoccus sp. SC2-64]MBM